MQCVTAVATVLFYLPFLLIGLLRWNTFFKDALSSKYVNCPPDSLVWSYIVPGHCTLKYFVCQTICFNVNYPPDTLLQSKLTLGHFNLKQTVPSQGENLHVLQEKSVSFKVKCPRWTVCSEVKCPGDSLLRSNSPLGHFTSGVKLSCEWSGNMTTSSQEAHTTIPYWRPGPSLVLRPSHHPVFDRLPAWFILSCEWRLGT